MHLKHSYLLPSLAVVTIALFMHVLRVQHVQLNLMVQLMLLYMAGMAAGAFAFAIKKEASRF